LGGTEAGTEGSQEFRPLDFADNGDVSLVDEGGDGGDGGDEEVAARAPVVDVC
jgi:hypothetical protein